MSPNTNEYDRADKLQVKPSERFSQSADRTISTSTASFRVLYRDDVDETMQVVDDAGRTWGIEGIVKKGRQNMTLILGRWHEVALPAGDQGKRQRRNRHALDQRLLCRTVRGGNGGGYERRTGRWWGTGSGSPPSALTDTLSPSLLRSYASTMLLRGEFVALVDIDDDGVLGLVQAHEVEVGGSWRPSSWVYRLRIPRPGGEDVVRRSPAAGVIHVKWNEKSSSPWLGRSPLESAGLTSGQLANIERSLGHDASIPTGALLAVPDAASKTQVAQAKNAISSGKGGLSLLETTSSGWGKGGDAKPAKDLQQIRFGGEVPQTNVQLRDSSAAAVMACLGLNRRMFDGDGSSAESAYLLLVTGVCQTLCSLLEREVEDKLEIPVQFDLSPAHAADIRGLGRAIGAMVNAGMSLADAQEAAGLTGSRL